MKSGIAFPEGASATLSSSVLLVTNTPTELDKVEQLVEAIATKQPKQVKITTKFVEISQEDGEELGFDWIIGPFGNSGGHLFGSGGTIGNGTPRTAGDFVSPVDYTTIPGVPAGAGETVSNITTAGLRSVTLRLHAIQSIPSSTIPTGVRKAPMWRLASCR